MRKHRNRGVILTVLLGLVAVLFVGCSGDSEPTAAERRREARNAGVEAMASEDLKTGNYSPTIETIQFWLDTWTNEPGKLAFIYFSDAEGDMLGYYVIEGLPVSYGTGGTPPYDFESRDVGGATGDVLVPAPSLDGVWYSGSEARRYYAKEAVTGAYLEWFAGNGINQFLKDRPIRGLDLGPWTGGETTIEDVQEN
jgi:hypothetical protein